MIIGLIVLNAPAGQAQPVTFNPATNFAVETNPFSVAVGDYSGDGKPELAVVNQGGNIVAILIGSGNGIFEPVTNFAVGTNPQSVAVGDFNGDGKMDLVVANAISNNVSILLGNGSDGFVAATNFTVGTNPTSVAAGDFNGDGKPDLAVVNQNSNNVSMLLNSTVFSGVVPAVSVSDLTVAEGNSGAVSREFTVTLSQAGGQTITVTFNTGNGSATAGSDYISSSGTVTFNPGETQKKSRY